MRNKSMHPDVASVHNLTLRSIYATILFRQNIEEVIKAMALYCAKGFKLSLFK